MKRFSVAICALRAGRSRRCSRPSAPSVHERAQSDANKATEVGVTPTEIRIAVVADVDNPFAPGLFQGVGRRRAGRGEVHQRQRRVAGRKVVVDFIDSKLNAERRPQRDHHGVRAGLRAGRHRQRCSCTNVDDVDRAARTRRARPPGIPDLAAFVDRRAGGVRAGRVPDQPPSSLCDTKDEHPQTYQGNQGDSKYLLKQQQGPARLVRAGQRLAGRRSRRRRGAQQGGPGAAIKADQLVDRRRGRDPQSAYTPIIQAMKNDSSNYGLSAPGGHRRRRRSAGSAAPGAHRPRASCGSAPSPATTTTSSNGGRRHGRQYMPLQFLPFDESRRRTNDAGQLREVRGQGQGRRLRRAAAARRASRSSRR